MQLMIFTWSKRIITAVAEYKNRLQLRHKNTNLSSRTTQISSVEFRLSTRCSAIVRGHRSYAVIVGVTSHVNKGVVGLTKPAFG